MKPYRHGCGVLTFLTRALLLSLWLVASITGHAGTADTLNAAASEHRSGHFPAALTYWQQAIQAARAAGDADAEARAHLGAARSYLAAGRASLAMRRLDSAYQLAERLGNEALLGQILATQGSARALTGDSTGAREALARALAFGERSRDPDLAARSANDLAALEAEAGNWMRAAELYRQVMASARTGGNPAMEATAAVNLARVPLPPGERTQALAEAERLVRALPASHVRALALVSLGRLLGDLAVSADVPGASRARAVAVLEEAATTARQTGDQRTLSYALGYRGALEEAAGSLDSALALSRQAALAAQLANAPESQFRWERQAGRILRRLGDEDAALTAYRVAASTLDRVRLDLASGGRGSFRAEASPVYLELADLLIRRAENAAAPGYGEAYLREARQTMEALKGAELEDFFQDDCVAALKSKTSGIDTLAPGTAALYPIILPDRLALLVSLPEGLRVYSSPVGARQVEAEARALRQSLEKRTTREYLRHARKLHDWVIRPVEADLRRAGVKTLVFVPDGVLRTIPLAALHDGETFLIERYSVATSPGLTLTDPRPLASSAPRALMAGLSESVQGFAPLPGVGVELDTLTALLPGTVLRDNGFQTARFRDALTARPYTIVHVASHGVFGPTPQETFLLTHDGRIDLNELEALLGGTAYREHPVELLALSACQTAAGDDRAALGLAGVAVKAGARGAMATLWSVSDTATTGLVDHFYHRLREGKLNKAESLREAQMTIMADRRYRHPYYWSPFLLIGNWL